MWKKLDGVTEDEVETRLDMYPVGLHGEPLGWGHALTHHELKAYRVFGMPNEDDGAAEMRRDLRDIGGLDGADELEERIGVDEFFGVEDLGDDEDAMEE
jgi:hypothetical protein